MNIRWRDMAIAAALAVALGAAVLAQMAAYDEGRYGVYWFASSNDAEWEHNYTYGDPLAENRLLNVPIIDFLVCDVEGKRYVPPPDLPYAGEPSILVLDVAVREMLTQNAPLARKRFDMQFLQVYPDDPAVDSLRVGDRIALLIWVCDEDYRREYQACYTQGDANLTFHVTKNDVLIPISVHPLFSYLAGMRLDEAKEALLAAQAGEALPRHTRINRAETAIDDWIDENGEFRVPGLPWGMSVQAYLDAPYLSKLDGCQTLLNAFFDDEGRLTETRVDMYAPVPGASSDPAWWAEMSAAAFANAPMLAERLKEARAAAGFGAALSGKSSSVEVIARPEVDYYHTPHITLILRGKP